MLWQTGILVAGLLGLYASVLADLAGIWWTRDNYSHGFLIVPMSLYLVWVKKSELRQLPLNPGSVWGVSLIVAAGFLLLLGRAGSVIVVGGLSFVGMIVGLVLFLLGNAFVKALGFPIAYLIFMIPIFDELLAPLHWPLQLLTADVSVRFLHMVGVSALVDQQYIVLPHTILEVAAVCSGTNYLISILAIGLPLAYLTLRTWWSRVALVFLGVATGVGANWVRVVLIGIWANSGGEVLHGPLELFRAMFVACVGVLALLGGAWSLSKMEKVAAQKHAARLVPVRQRSGERSPPLEWNRSWCTALMVLLAFGGYITLRERGPVDLKEDFATFPVSIDGWVAKRSDLREAIFRIEGADRELLRVYQNHESGPIQLYVAYLAAQRQGKKIADYRTASLHQKADVREITVRPGWVVAVNLGRVPGPRTEHQIIFWYDVNGRVIADPYKARLQTIRDALLHGRTNGALVLIATDPVADTGTAGQMEAFTRALLPRLRSYLP